MSEFQYRVSAVETVETERGKTRTAILTADGSTSDEIRLTDDGLSVGDRVIVKVTKEEEFSLHFLHHFDRKNQGDRLSGPYRYFNFDGYDTLSWDAQIQKAGRTTVKAGDALILGGGIYFTKNKPNLMKLIKRARVFVGWGIGLDERSGLDEFLPFYTLLGTRERKSPYIDGQRVFYVPCASCMNSAFDGAGPSPSTEIALHLNGGFNEKTILQKFKGAPCTTTVTPFADTLKNLQAADCVVTNSYHGAYWGSLLGKRVVCVPTEVPKWSGLHENVAVTSSMEEVDGVIRKARHVPDGYRQECREINRDFYERVTALL